MISGHFDFVVLYLKIYFCSHSSTIKGSEYMRCCV